MEYIHPLDCKASDLPERFTYPFRYEAHPLCRRAAQIVQLRPELAALNEGKMFGVLVCRRDDAVYFLAAYSGQLNGNYAHPWFVPPVLDYLQPNGYFLTQQQHIISFNQRVNKILHSSDYQNALQLRQKLLSERQQAIDAARQAYIRGKQERDAARLNGTSGSSSDKTLILQSQHQRADIRRATRLHEEALKQIQSKLDAYDSELQELRNQHRHLSEALQQWLFDNTRLLNAEGNQLSVTQIWARRAASTNSNSPIPSGAGECCAPKLLHAAYSEGLQPIAMAEFWCGPSSADGLRHTGEFYPACQRKCRPILQHMMHGLNVMPDPAIHYDTPTEPLSIIWQDSHLAAIYKPTGWLSIPGTDNQPNVLDEARRIWPEAQGSIIVHRLDQDTSGIMLIAKTARDHNLLQRQFERREVSKRYVAILEQQPAALQRPGDETIISLPLSPCRDDLPRQHVDLTHGHEATSRIRLLSASPQEVRVEMFPLTGRTHQLRLHAASQQGLNAPIRGDRLYGHIADRLYLHAEEICFHHPATGEMMSLSVPCPF